MGVLQGKATVTTTRGQRSKFFGEGVTTPQKKVWSRESGVWSPLYGVVTCFSYFKGVVSDDRDDSSEQVQSAASLLLLQFSYLPRVNRLADSSILPTGIICAFGNGAEIVQQAGSLLYDFDPQKRSL